MTTGYAVLRAEFPSSEVNVFQHPPLWPSVSLVLHTPFALSLGNMIWIFRLPVLFSPHDSYQNLEKNT